MLIITIITDIDWNSFQSMSIICTVSEISQLLRAPDPTSIPP